MSDVIKLLPDSVANQIAAGEVIQRPASVVKELVENAIDAHATSVQIILKDAGRTLIQIIDNGTGMSETDARLAFERHSTSKIRAAEDLFSLHTMGFRGEALASIVAISQLELRTRRAQDQLGTRLVFNASTCESQEPDMCAPGSNFMVKNLFFNVPARRKFLKNNQVELSNILKEFEKLALVNYQVEFSISHNDTVLHKLAPGTFIQRIAALMGGRNFDQQLLPVNIDTSLVKVEGYIGKPEFARRRNFLQFFFVNGRYMRHPYFHKSVLSAYEQLIPADMQPNYFLRFEVEPQSIDVNIHPTKTEIKFEDEIAIWQILQAGVREALGRFNEVPSIDFDNEDAPEIPAFSKHPDLHRPTIDVDPGYNPFKNDSVSASGSAAGAVRKRPATSIHQDWERLYEDFQKQKADSTATPEQSPDVFVADHQTMYLQMKGRYILSPIKSGLMVIDQHRAHVRVLYNRYISRMNVENIGSQTMLFPEQMQLSPAQSATLDSLLPDLERIGFVLSRLSGNDFTVSSMPAGLDGVDVKEFLRQLIDSVEQGGASVKDRISDHIALQVAKAAAIPYGRTLMQEEMDSLVSDLLKLSEPNYTPDGKPVIGVIALEDINKLF